MENVVGYILLLFMSVAKTPSFRCVCVCVIMWLNTLISLWLLVFIDLNIDLKWV